LKILIALIALVLMTAACGDDAGTATTAAPPSSAAATTSQPPATAAPATTAAPTTTAAPATTADPLAEIGALLAQYTGAYEGTWNNTTFGSEGPIVGSIEFDAAALTLTMTVDLGGFVFGAFDPDPEVTVISLADLAVSPGGTMTITSATFGELVVSVTADGIEVFGADVPDPQIATILVTGPVTPEGFDLTYLIEFEDGGTAEGTATMHKSG